LSIALGAVLAQPRKGNIDHPIYFASRKLSDVEKNYMTTKREGLAMVYALKKFRHYLLGFAFKFFIDHSALKYLVNKSVLGGQICHWLLLFQVFDFEVVVKLGKYNVGLYHLSRIETGEVAKSLGEELPDAQLFRVEVVPNQLAEIMEFLMTSQDPTGYTLAQRRQLVTRSAEYQLIVGQLYKMGADGILRRCAIECERNSILYETHEGIVGGHNVGKATVHKVLCAELWWPSLFADAKLYCKHCNLCQRIGKPYKRDELPLFPVTVLEPLDKWTIDCVGPVNPPTHLIGAHYIIIATKYLTRWVEAAPIKNCIAETAARFIFENVITRFSYPRVLMSDQGSHFLNKNI
jgi:hypothetical protein